MARILEISMATKRWIEGTGPKETVVIVEVGNGGSGDGKVRLWHLLVGEAEERS